jgi:hypothetical protein
MAVTSPLAHIMKKQKLELTEIGKEHRPKLDPRILIKDPTQSHHAKQRATDNGLSIIAFSAATIGSHSKLWKSRRQGDHSERLRLRRIEQQG